MNTQDLLDEIYSNLDKAEVTRDLDPQDKGDYYLLTCPECGKKEAYLYKTGLYIKCNRLDKCGYSISLWDYVQTTKELSNQETLRELARLSGVTLSDLTGYSEDRAKEIRKRANLLEKALDYFKIQLWIDKDKEALKYLKKKRGYTETEIKAIELGFYPSQKDVEDYLVNKVNKVYDVYNVGLKTQGFGKTHKLVIPYKDPIGRLKGFIVRTIKKGIEPKYLYSKGLKRDILFNLNEARRGEKDLIVTEGYLDALISTQREIKGVVATGGSRLTKAQLENSIKYKVKSFILALDNDKAGQDGTEKSIRLINEKGLKSYVVILPEGYDPDDLIREKGTEAFKKAIKEAKSGVKWNATRILSKYDLETDKGRDDALEESLIFEETIKDPMDSKDFLDSITTTLDISREVLEPRIKGYHDKKAQERLKKGYERFFREGLELNKIEDIEKHIDKLRDLRGLKSEPSIALDTYLEEKYQKDSKRERDTLLGYKLKKFSEIAKKIDGIQPGLYIIGSETNTGKTAFLTNLFLDLFDTNPELRGMYFSLDDNKDVIIDRFISIITRIDINKAKRKQDNKRDQDKVKGAYEKLEGFWKKGRLDIKDLSEINHIDTLETEIRGKVKGNFFVAIDGIYNLEVGKGYSGIREENIERAQKVKALVDIYKIPILCTGELRKKTPGQSEKRTPTRDDIMETGKFSYNSTLIWLLYPEDRENFEEGSSPILRLKFDKNKLSSFTGYQKLEFIKVKGILKET